VEPEPLIFEKAQAFSDCEVARQRLVRQEEQARIQEAEELLRRLREDRETKERERDLLLPQIAQVSAVPLIIQIQPDGKATIVHNGEDLLSQIAVYEPGDQTSSEIQTDLMSRQIDATWAEWKE
jgi:hypothetical protein